MKRLLLAALLLGLLMMPTLPGAATGQETKPYTITNHSQWVKVDKRLRVGAGEITHYFRKDRVLAVTVESPGQVTVTLEDAIEFSFEFVGVGQANSFAQDLIKSL